jgi:hypothetical protein
MSSTTPFSGLLPGFRLCRQPGNYYLSNTDGIVHQYNFRVAVIRPQPWNIASGGTGDTSDCPINQKIIVQKENVACAKMRRAAEPELNAPPARDVERSK